MSVTYVTKLSLSVSKSDDISAERSVSIHGYNTQLQC